MPCHRHAQANDLFSLGCISSVFSSKTRPLMHEVSVTGRICLSNFMSIWYTDSYLNFSHIWLEMPIQAPKMGVLGDFGPLNVIIHHWDPLKVTSLRKSASFKLSTVKNPLRGLTCSRVDRKCDGHTHRHTQVLGKFIFCLCITVDRQWDMWREWNMWGWSAAQNSNNNHHMRLHARLALLSH